MKKLIIFLTVITVLVIAGAAIASSAKENMPVLEKKVFIHYKEGFANKPSTRSSSCYAFMGRGLKLDIPEGLVISPDLDRSAIVASAGEWDNHTSASLFNSYTVDATANWDDDVPDGRNELSFGDYPQDGVIAVTISWGYFSGPIGSRRITEFDIMFDNTDFVWGDADVDSSAMDLQNIATHEIGHGLGLADVYQSSCNQVTMYGYSKEGDIVKRTLETPDIIGLQSLYGN